MNHLEKGHQFLSNLEIYRSRETLIDNMAGRKKPYPSGHLLGMDLMIQEDIYMTRSIYYYHIMYLRERGLVLC